MNEDSADTRGVWEAMRAWHQTACVPGPDRCLCCDGRLIDFGSVYASKTFRTNDNRTIWMGWVFETSIGCTEQCSAGSPLTQTWARPGPRSRPACC